MLAATWQTLRSRVASAHPARPKPCANNSQCLQQREAGLLLKVKNQHAEAQYTRRMQLVSKRLGCSKQGPYCPMCSCQFLSYPWNVPGLAFFQESCRQPHTAAAPTPIES